MSLVIACQRSSHHRARRCWPTQKAPNLGPLGDHWRWWRSLEVVKMAEDGRAGHATSRHFVVCFAVFAVCFAVCYDYYAKLLMTWRLTRRLSDLGPMTYSASSESAALALLSVLSMRECTENMKHQTGQHRKCTKWATNQRTHETSWNLICLISSKPETSAQNCAPRRYDAVWCSEAVGPWLMGLPSEACGW